MNKERDMTTATAEQIRRAKLVKQHLVANPCKTALIQNMQLKTDCMFCGHPSNVGSWFLATPSDKLIMGIMDQSIEVIMIYTLCYKHEHMQKSDITSIGEKVMQNWHSHPRMMLKIHNQDL